MKPWTFDTIPKDRAIFVSSNLSGAYQLIVAILPDGVEIFDSGGENGCVFVTYEELLLDGIMPDGSRCGNEEEK